MELERVDEEWEVEAVRRKRRSEREAGEAVGKAVVVLEEEEGGSEDGGGS